MSSIAHTPITYSGPSQELSYAPPMYISLTYPYIYPTILAGGGGDRFVVGHIGLSLPPH